MLKKYTVIGNILFYVGLIVFIAGLIIRDSKSDTLAPYVEHSNTIMISGIVLVFLTNFFRKKKQQPAKKQ